MNVACEKFPKYTISDLDKRDYDTIIKGLKAIKDKNIVAAGMVYHLEAMRGDNA